MKPVTTAYKSCAALVFFILLTHAARGQQQTTTISTVIGGARLINGGTSPVTIAAGTSNAIVIAPGTIQTVVGGVPNNTIALAVGMGTNDGVPHVALDSSGNLYIPDTQNNAIYKVSISGELTTVAGIGTGGYTGDGGPATSAELAFPQGVSVDRAGDIFIADSFNNVIREVVASTGKIQTVAGNGSAGFSGDGGPATSAELFTPRDVFVDNAGDIFIADDLNNVVREVVASTGIIRTVAGNGVPGFSGDGGLATSAELSSPTAVFVDNAGNIFIADQNNQRIREVVASTGTIQTVAGNGIAGFSGDGGPATSAELLAPADVFVDSAGDIFIADEANHRIREVVASTGTIQTVAGIGFCGFSGDGRPATSAELCGPTGVFLDSAGDIFMFDNDNNRIREVVRSSGEIQTVAGNGTLAFTGDLVPANNAELDLPLGVFVDDVGNIFIADTNNVRIREVVASTDKIQTVAGNGVGGISGDGGPATSAELASPQGVFVDRAGDIFIADRFSSVIREVIASTGEIQTVAGNGTHGYSGDGGPATNAELSNPEAVFVDSAGDIFIADGFSSVIREVVASTGKIQTVAGNGSHGFSGDGGPATSAELSDPQGVFVDSAGDIFIADTANQRIREVVAPTGTIQTVAGIGNVNGNGGFNGDGGPATSAELNNPQGVFVDSAGNVFFADSQNNRIREVVASTGAIQTVAGNGIGAFGGDGGPAVDASLAFPASVWGDKIGSLFVADSGNSRIRMVAGLISVPSATLSPLSAFTGSQPTQTATLTNSGTAPLLISSLAISGANPGDFTFGSPTTCPISGGTLEQGSSCTLTISLASSVISGGAKSGTVSGNATLTVTHDAALGTPTPTATGSGSGQFQQLIPLAVNYAAPVLSFSPASLTFTVVNVPQTITLQNNGDTPLSITGITPPTGFVLGAAAANSCSLLTPSVNAPLAVSGNGSCNLNVAFTGPEGSSNGLLVFADDGFSPAGSQSVALTGFALIPSGSTSFTISNSAPAPVTANFNLVGVGTTSFTPVCVITPAGLGVNCSYSSANQTIAATVQLPSCVVAGGINDSPVTIKPWTIWPVYAVFALMLVLIRLRTTDGWKRRYVLLAFAVICVSGAVLSSCGNSTTVKSSSCVASVNPGTVFMLNVTATTTSGQVPSLTLTSPDTITVTQ